MILSASRLRLVSALQARTSPLEFVARVTRPRDARENVLVVSSEPGIEPLTGQNQPSVPVYVVALLVQPATGPCRLVERRVVEVPPVRQHEGPHVHRQAVRRCGVLLRQLLRQSVVALHRHCGGDDPDLRLEGAS